MATALLRMSKGWVRASQVNQATPRSSHSVTHANNKIYIFGGELQPRVPIGNEMWVYDIPSDSWESTITSYNPPPLRVAHAAVALNGDIYLFGGRNANKEELGDLWKWNTVSHEWSEIVPKSETKPSGRSYHGMVVVGGKIYVFGGCSASGRQNDLWAFDTETAEWSQLTSVGGPIPRGGPAVVGTEKDIYVFYGFNGTELADIFAFDTQAREWREIKTTGDNPTPRSVHAAAYLGNNKVFMFGGEGSPSHLGHEGAGKHFGDAFILDLESLVWTRIPSDPSAPCPRGWIASTSIPNSGAAVFGGLADDNTRQADLHLFYAP